MLSDYVSLRSELCCDFRIKVMLGFMSYLRYLCLIAHSRAEHVLCCVLVLFFFVLCTLFSQFIWIVNFVLLLRYSLTVIDLVIRYIKSAGNEFKLEMKLLQKQRFSPCVRVILI